LATGSERESRGVLREHGNARIGGWLLAVVCLIQVAAAGAQEVGTIAAREGTVEIGRANEWLAAAQGAPVQLGDRIRTGTPGRARIVLRDESVLNVGDASELTIDQQVFDPNEGRFQSLIRLLKGKVRAIVSEYYEQPLASYQIETATAVSGVRGTEFVVQYDLATDSTSVVGIVGTVEVRSTIDPARPGVLISAYELTMVRRGEYPSPPVRIEERLFRQYLDGLEFIGRGRSEGRALGHALASGAAVPSQEQSSTVSAQVAPPPAPAPAAVQMPGWEGSFIPDAGTLVGQSPAIVEQLLGAGRGQLGVRF
jgi:hypothetical protein